MAAMNAAHEATTRPRTSAVPTAPRGRCRDAVRGLAASIARSTSRLKAIAAVRAVTMQTRMPTRDLSQGSGADPAALAGLSPDAIAISTAMIANGSAKIVWLNRTSSR